MGDCLPGPFLEVSILTMAVFAVSTASIIMDEKGSINKFFALQQNERRKKFRDILKIV
jgi:hypothetical protein